jgi:catalase
MTKAFKTARILFALLISVSVSDAIAEDIDQLANGMIQYIKAIQNERAPTGLIKRFNQGKSLGCFDAKFEVATDLPPDLKKGLFKKPGRYDALIRFANADTTDDRDKDLRGMSIKVIGVEGDTVSGVGGEQNFLLNSYPALFVDTPETFYKFIQATYRDERWKFFVNPLDSHLKSLWIVFRAREHHTSPFDIRYWSTTPYRFAKDDIVKYSATPCSTVHSELPDTLTQDYLQENMEHHLAQAPVCFDFMVQFQTDESDMPIEDASVIWDEDESPFLKVARITIQNQKFRDAESLAACEQTNFNPRQSLLEHAPVGRMNQVRMKLYSVISRFRLGENSLRSSQK